MPLDVAATLPAAGLSPAEAAEVLRAADARDAVDVGPGDAARFVHACVVVAGDPRLMPRALRPLLALLSPRRDTLSPFAGAVASHLRGIVAWRLDGDVPVAIDELNRSLEALETLGEPGPLAYAGRVHDTLGQLLHHQGLLVDAREAYERALLAKEAGGDVAGRALTLGNLGRLCMALGDFRAAARHLTDDLAVVEASVPPVPRVVSQLLNQLGTCRTELGELDEARRCLIAARTAAHAVGDAMGVGFAEVALGRLAMRAGDLDGGAAHAAAAGRALATLPETAPGHPELRGLVAQLVARTRWARDDAAGALVAAEEAGRAFEAATRATGQRAGHASLAGRQPAARAVASLRAPCRARRDVGRAMRARIDDALRRLDETAWMLHASGRFVGHAQLEELLGEAGRSGFRGHDEEVTVLFSDLRGFTRVSETLAPDVLVELLNRYFGHMTRCVEHFGGRVDKLIGDAVMAVFDARPGTPGHADRAVAAALYMQADLARFNRALRGVGPLRAGIGLHAGRVVAGLLGSPQKRSYTVIGDVVNTASRVEGMSKLLDAPILLTGDVVARLSEPARLVLLPLGLYRPVGRSAPVAVHAVAGRADGSPEARARAARAEAAHLALARFTAGDLVDAERHFAALRDAPAWAVAFARSPQRRPPLRRARARRRPVLDLTEK
jgi:class 3 adenylate cyclase